jgi:hypothetical protein
MSDTALLSLKVPSLRLLVLIIIVKFKMKMKISVEHLWYGTDRVAGKYYCTHFNIVGNKSDIYWARFKPRPPRQYSLATLCPYTAYLAGNTRYLRVYLLSLIYFLLVRDDFVTGYTNAYSDIHVCQ